jgi:DNA-binding helix-hairpin-helix protein with protein kinase domain
MQATDWRPRDIFCMAAMIYQTLTGNHPFDRRDDPDFPDVGSQAEAIKTGLETTLLDFEFQRNSKFEWTHSKSTSPQREPLTFWMLPTPLRRILTRTLIDGFAAPEKRPSSEEWVTAICELCKTKLVKCENGHTHFRNITVCPECFPVSFFQ